MNGPTRWRIVLRSSVLVLLAFGVAGFVVGAGVTTTAILLRARRALEPTPRPPMSSWTEEAQEIHRCARCGRKIVKSREGDRQIVRRAEAGIEHYHVGCWDEEAGAPKP